MPLIHVRVCLLKSNIALPSISECYLFLLRLICFITHECHYITLLLVIPSRDKRRLLMNRQKALIRFRILVILVVIIQCFIIFSQSLAYHGRLVLYFTEVPHHLLLELFYFKVEVTELVFLFEGFYLRL